MSKSNILRVCKGFGHKEGSCKNMAVNPSKSPYCRNCAGTSFEVQTGNLFGIQGYSVRHNIRLSGTQHDIFAEITLGITKIGMLVECKYKFDENESVNSEDVRKFHGSFTLFNSERKFGRADKACIITNGKFAPEAYEVAKALDIELYTEFELVKNLLNFEPYLKRIIDDYKTSILPNHYIELNSTSGGTLTKSVFEFLESEDDEALVILGDYGTGKTSTLLKLCSDLATDVLNGKESTIPLLIQLRDYEKAFNLEQLITNLLVNRYHIPNANFDTFLELVRAGYILFVFDGFDEVARRVDYATKNKVFNEISRFASIQSKVIVSARPNFFNHREEFEKLFKASALHYEPNQRNVYFNEVYIDELTVDQIEYYVGTFKTELESYGFTVDDFLQLMNTVHDLTDLAKRPVLLNVIVETLPHVKDFDKSRINAAVLYDQYTGFWLNREDNKGKTLIRSEQKLLFSRQLAWKMFTNNKLSISYQELPKEVKDYFKLTTIEDVDHFSHDIKSCAFLHNDDGNGYKFIHKSFMEYFTAIHILTELEKITPTHSNSNKVVDDILSRTLITMEVGLYIRDLFDAGRFSQSRLLELVESLDMNKIHTVTMKNITSLVAKTEGNVTLLLQRIKDLENVDLSFAVIKNGTLKRTNLMGASFYGAKIQNVKFDKCVLANSIFRKSRIENSEFHSCNLEVTDFSSALIEDSTLQYSSLAYSRFGQCVVKRSDFDGVELTNLEHNDETSIIDCYNLDTTSGMPYTLSVLVSGTV